MLIVFAACVAMAPFRGGNHAIFSVTRCMSFLVYSVAGGVWILYTLLRSCLIWTTFFVSRVPHQLGEQMRMALRNIPPLTACSPLRRLVSSNVWYTPFLSRSRGKNSRFYAADLESLRHRLRHQPCSVSVVLPVLLTNVVTSLVNVATRSVDGGGRHFLGAGQQVYEFQCHRVIERGTVHVDGVVGFRSRVCSPRQS